MDGLVVAEIIDVLKESVMPKRKCAICGLEIEDDLDIGVFPKVDEVAHNKCFEELLNTLTSGQYSPSDLDLMNWLGFGDMMTVNDPKKEIIH